MHSQSSIPGATSALPGLPSLLAGLPPAGKLRPATMVCAGLTYARVSKSIQTTIPAQQERMIRLARSQHVPVTCELSDTGSGMRCDRDGYQRLLTEVASGQYSHVFLFKADRLARDSVELQGTVKRLWRLGMTVMDTSVGEITPQNLPVLAMLAEMEIRNLSERTDMGLEQIAKGGHKIGGIPLGYRRSERKGQPEKDPEWADVISELFQRAARGDGIAELGRWMAATTGQAVQAKRIRGILRNPYYMGLTVNFRTRESIVHGEYGRDQADWCVRPHGNALTDQETWQQVQRHLDRHQNVGQHRAQSSIYALQGLVKCAVCQRRMYGHNKPPKDRNYTCYCCPVCHVERSTRKVEAAVRRCLSTLELDSREAAAVLTEELVARRAGHEARARAARQRIVALTEKRQRLYDRLDSGEIDQEQYRDQVSRLDAERSAEQQEEVRLRAEVAALPEVTGLIADVAAARAEWLAWPEKIPGMAVSDQQSVYRECCKEVVVDAARNVVTVHYNEHIALLMGEASHSEQF